MTEVRFYVPNFESGQLLSTSSTIETYSVREDYLYYYTFTELFTHFLDGIEVFPNGTSYLTITIDGTLAHITVSDHLLSFDGDIGQSELLLRSIVYTATEFADINQVCLHIVDSKGNRILQFNGISLDKPFSRTSDYASVYVTQ